jgi:DNA-binding transcriptional ArsR family regulator
MVHYLPDRLDGIFSALADPTRRAVLARLRGGERSVGELAEPFGMSLPGFIKHLGILQDAGLIERKKTGRVVSCQLKGGALKGAIAWLERHEEFWNTQLDQLGAFLEEKEIETWKPQSTKRPDSKSDASTTSPSPKSTPRGRTPSK